MKLITQVFDIHRTGPNATLKRDEDCSGISRGQPWAAIFDDDVYESLNTERAVN